MCEEIGTRVTTYDGGEGEGAMVFIARCPHCGRFTKADPKVTVRGDGQPVGDNSTCKVHGRVAMGWLGYY